jgi:hypothetical protein
MMEKRNALKLLGILIVGLVGRFTLADDKSPRLEFRPLDLKPLDYVIYEDSVRNIIIYTKEERKLVIPFDDIVKALETSE